MFARPHKTLNNVKEDVTYIRGLDLSNGADVC